MTSNKNIQPEILQQDTTTNRNIATDFFSNGSSPGIEEKLWSRADAMKLYQALFHIIPDALILADSKFHILAVNSNAASLFGTPELDLAGFDCRTIIEESFRSVFSRELIALAADGSWSRAANVLTVNGTLFPAELSVNKVCVAGDMLLQIVVRDMSAHATLEQDLQRTEAVVEGMNLALRHVIQSVNEERKEMKDELVQQVKDQVLPTIERIADEDSSDIRQNYKSVIEDQLLEMADGVSDLLDSILIRLTPREVEICRLITLGRKSREICELLQLTFETMQTHRKNIRRKLGLTGRRISLYVYLQQQNSLHSTR